MNRIRTFITALSLVIICGCENHNRYGSIYTPYIPMENSIILFRDSTTLLSARMDGAWITQVSLLHDILTLTVKSGGGCALHDYTLYGDIRFIQSRPVQADVYLSHDSHGDRCDAIITNTVSFDLSALKRAYTAQFPNHGPLLLRIHEPLKDEPLQPFISYWF
jgi:hypothetical protein